MGSMQTAEAMLTINSTEQIEQSAPICEPKPLVVKTKATAKNTVEEAKKKAKGKQKTETKEGNGKDKEKKKGTTPKENLIMGTTSIEVK